MPKNASANQLQTPKAITDNGWDFYDKCICSGVLKYKYRHPGKKGMELHWLPKAYAFKVIENNKVRVGRTKIDKLEQKLKEL